MSLNSLLSTSYTPTDSTEIQSTLTYKPLHLHPNSRPPLPTPTNPPPSKPLPAKTKRALKILQIPKSLPPATLTSLHALWTGYAKELLSSTSSPAAAAQLMASAEFVGAKVEVVRSRCASLVGIRGVCVVEGRRVIQLAGDDGKVRSVEKGVCVFRVEVAGRGVFEVHGCRFGVRAGERGAKKFKGRAMLEL